MITAQEVGELGCTSTQKSCPTWMSNYLSRSTSYGGTVNGTDYGYWTMSVFHPDIGYAMYVGCIGSISNHNTTGTSFGARAVVEINK